MHHQIQHVAVYRYYCRNPQCQTQTFTDLPAGSGALLALPHWKLHLLALQMYAWGYSTYRRTGTALGVSQHDRLALGQRLGRMTCCRWRPCLAWCKSSGVVGVDEKYVLVPKNDKPAGKMRRWMYVYLAVDV